MTGQTRTTPYNMGIAKVAVQFSEDTFVVNQSLVPRINICGENHHLRKARKLGCYFCKVPKKYYLCKVVFQTSSTLCRFGRDTD